MTYGKTSYGKHKYGPREIYGLVLATGVTATSQSQALTATIPSAKGESTGVTASSTSHATTATVKNMYLIDTAATALSQSEALTAETYKYGVPGNYAVYIDGDRRFQGVMNVEIEENLNELDTFTFDAFIEGDYDRSLVQEGEEILMFDGLRFLFKGTLEEVNYDSQFKATCEGSGQFINMLNRKTDRKEYINMAGDTIIRDILGDNPDIELGTIESAPEISIRVDHDNELRAAAGVANAVGYDLFVENGKDDDFEADTVHFVERQGSESSVATLEIAEEIQVTNRDKDLSAVANDITILGRGDGVNQLECNLFAASTHRTLTDQKLDPGDTTTLDVVDATQLGSTGDELYVRVGSEVVHAEVQDSTTLNILGRGQPDHDNESTEDLEHFYNIQVFLQENVTQGIGPFKPNRDEAEDGSSIDNFGVREDRGTDKTIIDRATLEKITDNELKDRRQDIFRVSVELTDPRGLDDIGVELGDTVTIRDLTAPDVDDDFRVVGIDIVRASGEEKTVLHCANRPLRLVERLSEMERDRDTLNAHMQGATNINGEAFSDNCDANNPLSNKIRIPDDAVKINKVELTFTRQSFRGYVKNQSHDHSFSIPAHNHDLPPTFPLVLLDVEGGQFTGPVDGDPSSSDHVHEQTSIAGELLIDEDGTPTTENAQQTSDTSSNSGSPEYGIFEPASEPDIDVDIYVDGTFVTTINGLSVGETVSNPLEVQQYLNEPIAGNYHEIELVPVDTGGGEDGRCRLKADVYSKVFVESKL